MVRLLKQKFIVRNYEKKHPYSFIQSKGFTANAELLVKCGQITREIGEIPFVYDYGVKQGKSKLGVLKTIFEYLSFIFDIKSVLKKMKIFLDQ